MGIPFLVIPDVPDPRENAVLALGHEHTKHLAALRLSPGAALEVLLPSGSWRAELTTVGGRGASIRLLSPSGRSREAPIEIHACLPLTAKAALWADFLPGVVELGATLIQPVIYERSQYDPRAVDALMPRWERIIRAACGQAHRTRVPDLLPPIPLPSLSRFSTPQRWVAYEVQTEEPNPTPTWEDLAFTHGPEGGITDAEITLLLESGWAPVTLGSAILRASTCPAAILGALQMELGRKKAKGPNGLGCAGVE